MRRVTSPAPETSENKDDMKTALVTGVTGQDGAYLSKLLLERGYRVLGGARRSASGSLWRLQELGVADDVEIVSLELSEPSNIDNVIRSHAPDEIYNLAAQSFVAQSFETPLYTGDVDGLAVLRLLESVRSHTPEAKFYQASTSEMFGKVRETPQSESTPFHPRSPYGCAKVFAHHSTVNYRESYDLFACSGILFNHESPLRGEEFVTRKITTGVAAQVVGSEAPLLLGNMDSERDWGFAGDYVEAMWLMLQQDQPDDYVIASGRTSTVRKFVEAAFQSGGIEIQWEGSGVEEQGRDAATGQVRVGVDPRYFRPAEVDLLCGDISKASQALGWKPTMTLEQLVEVMVSRDIERTRVS